MTDKKHDADLHRVSSQNSVTDFARGVEEGPRGGFLDGFFRSAVEATPFGRAITARTDFDKRDLDLNKMIDMVEQTDPEDLESSGKALWDARDAIKAAADELDGHIDKVHWVGESGDAFREWGAKLVTNTHHLSEFAGSAGDQITAAAVGLASVRGAMPARDTQASRKRPEHFTAAEKTADKDEYAAAVKVEKNRQEAINQMNRLGSYYAVSEEVLASLPAKDKTPEFTSMPDVGVPQPSRQIGVERPAAATGSPGSSGVAPGAFTGHHVTAASPVAHHATSDSPTPKHDTNQHKISLPDQPVGSVGTNIDSTATLPPPTTAPAHSAPPITSTPPAGDALPNVTGGGLGTPIPTRASGRGISGGGGFRTPTPTQGRAGTSGPTLGSGRPTGQGPTNQMGRATETGQSAARGTGSGAKSSPMGRGGVTGGTTRAAGTAGPRANGGPATGAGRSNGVVGGRPTATGGATPKSGSRLPRGTVIGGEETANSRYATGRPGAKPGASEAVTGRPTARNSTAGAERNGMTRGGTGLVRGGRKERRRDEEETEGTPRPDYLIEDDETHLSSKHRRDVPPVID
ncbi:hypothetical protein [Streptomyces sp. NPDC005435]|uniref:hypothetical protein n=1 Tax=Streptomyces sp. NPDC005435 TaxID=3154464 RepID=UPI003452165E